MIKNVVVAIDGSDNSIKTLDYIGMLFGAESLGLDLIYIMPALPPLFDDPEVRRQAKKQLETIEIKNRELGESILLEAKQRLKAKSLNKELVKSHLETSKLGTARDICNFAGKNKALAIAVGARGRSRLEKFFAGSVSGNIIQYSKSRPVWLVNGEVKSKKVLVALDASENAMNAADHAAFMFENIPVEITLFHTKRDLTRFIPWDVLKDIPDIEELWQDKAEKQIEPFMQKALEKFRSKGIDESRISTQLVKGSRSPADDILKYARQNGFGTIVLGRHGVSDKKDLAMGGITGKILQDSANLAIWVC